MLTEGIPGHTSKRIKTNQERINADRRNTRTYKQGGKVWVKWPNQSAQTNKLDPLWMSPARVLERRGESSYNVQVKPNGSMEVHASDLKPSSEDDPAGQKIADFLFLPTVQPQDTTPDEWNVDKIVKHRMNKRGRLEFLTQWENAKGEDTWEPVDSFVHGFNAQLFKYCPLKGLKLDLLQYLQP